MKGLTQNLSPPFDLNFSLFKINVDVYIDIRDSDRCSGSAGQNTIGASGENVILLGAYLAQALGKPQSKHKPMIKESDCTFTRPHINHGILYPDESKIHKQT